MAIQIEVIDETNVGTEVAYYFRIPPEDSLPGANDPGKQPAGKALKGQELADFKAGTIVEILIEYPFSQMQPLSLEEKQSFFASEWVRQEPTAGEEYNDQYKLEGDYYEDNVWIDDEDVGQPVQGGGQP